MMVNTFMQEKKYPKMCDSKAAERCKEDCTSDFQKPLWAGQL